MREHFGSIVLFAAAAAVIPLIALNPGTQAPSAPPAAPVGASSTVSENTQEPKEVPATNSEAGQPAPPEEAPSAPQGVAVVEGPGRFKILDSATGKVFSVTEQEYVRGALAAEMPPTFHAEALKAQAVAAHTYALCSHSMQQDAPDPSLKGADFTADPADWKTYTTEETFRERYGDLAGAYWKAIADAADSVCDYVMLYDGEPIVAAYHSMNTGMTEDAANVWTGSAPYLSPVESRGDLLAPDYETKQRFPAETVGKALQKAYPDAELGEDQSAWITPGPRSESGYVLTVRAGGAELPAKDLRTLLGLRSTAFDLEYTGGELCFTVRGYGHGVGLSQYGADYYARQGMAFTEILEHYYPGASLGLIRSADGSR